MKSALTPFDFLARSAFVYRDKIAVVDGERRFTYKEFNERIHRLASALSRIGIEPGDRVAVLAPNTLMALEPHFAVPLAGAVLVMLNTRLQASELAWILNHCGAKASSAACRDRKSTRLNSSHGYISYAVFCLKKKKKNKQEYYQVYDKK